jgi:hypothetical protein
VGLAAKRHKDIEPQKGTEGSKILPMIGYVPYVLFCGKYLL